MKFSLAAPGHEPQLRRLVREQPMPGRIRLAFAHEPDWNRSQQVLGHTVQTIVATGEADEVLGCGVRAIRRVQVNGREAELGYLAGLRSLPKARGSVGLAQGYRFLRQLHQADRLVPAYLTTIVEANAPIARLLTAGRAGLPAYLDQGRIVTSAVLLGGRQPRAAAGGAVEIRNGAAVPWADIRNFLRAEGARHQFFPVLDQAGLAAPQFCGLDPTDFRVALQGGAVAGVAAAWDQSRVRQVLVAGYAPVLGWVRPAVNAGLRLARQRTLPAPGERLRFFHLALACIRDQDPGVFGSLLERFQADYRESAYDYFVVGLHERNPLRAALASCRAWDYHSRLYLVAWEDGREFCAALDPARIPHVETAML